MMSYANTSSKACKRPCWLAALVFLTTLAASPGCVQKAEADGSKVKTSSQALPFNNFHDLPRNSAKMRVSRDKTWSDPISQDDFTAYTQPLIWLTVGGQGLGDDVVTLGSLRYRPFMARELLHWWRSQPRQSNPLTREVYPLSARVLVSNGAAPDGRRGDELLVHHVTIDDLLRGSPIWEDKTTLDGGRTFVPCGTGGVCIWRHRNLKVQVTSFLGHKRGLEAIQACRDSTYGGYAAGTWKLPGLDVLEPLGTANITSLASQAFLPDGNGVFVWTSYICDDRGIIFSLPKTKHSALVSMDFQVICIHAE